MDSSPQSKTVFVGRELAVDHSSFSQYEILTSRVVVRLLMNLHRHLSTITNDALSSNLFGHSMNGDESGEHDAGSSDLFNHVMNGAENGGENGEQTGEEDDKKDDKQDNDMNMFTQKNLSLSMDPRTPNGR
jgi:hypothetical protein